MSMNQTGADAIRAAELATISVPLAGVAIVVAFLAGVFTGILPRQAQCAIWAGCGLAGGVLLGVAFGFASAGMTDVVTPLLRLVMMIASMLALGAGGWRVFRKGEGLEFLSEWGSLGQGMGGWRLGPASALLLVGVVLGGLALGLAGPVPKSGVSPSLGAGGPAKPSAH